jgi:hypothetical protein
LSGEIWRRQIRLFHASERPSYSDVIQNILALTQSSARPDNLEKNLKIFFNLANVNSSSPAREDSNDKNLSSSQLFFEKNQFLLSKYSMTVSLQSKEARSML